MKLERRSVFEGFVFCVGVANVLRGIPERFPERRGAQICPTFCLPELGMTTKEHEDGQQEKNIDATNRCQTRGPPPLDAQDDAIKKIGDDKSCKLERGYPQKKDGQEDAKQDASKHNYLGIRKLPAYPLLDQVHGSRLVIFGRAQQGLSSRFVS